MKKTKAGKIGIKKVTLQDLDEPRLNQLAGGSNVGGTCLTCTVCGAHTCNIECKTYTTC